MLGKEEKGKAMAAEMARAEPKLNSCAAPKPGDERSEGKGTEGVGFHRHQKRFLGIASPETPLARAQAPLPPLTFTHVCYDGYHNDRRHTVADEGGHDASRREDLRRDQYPVRGQGVL